ACAPRRSTRTAKPCRSIREISWSQAGQLPLPLRRWTMRASLGPCADETLPRRSSTLDVGLGPIGTGGDFVVPAALLVFPGNRGGLARKNLLAGGALGRFSGLIVSGECFRERAIDPVGPSSIVLDDLVSDLGHHVPRITSVSNLVAPLLARSRP